MEINEDKSQIIDIRRKSSEFLGFRFKAKKKRGKYVLQSHMTEKAMKNCKVELKKKICEIKRNPSAKEANKYNSMVLGKHNYYKTATNISQDMSIIAYILDKTIRVRLKLIRTRKGYKSDLYKSLYRNKHKEINIAEVTLFPIADIKHKSPMIFNQQKCDYAVKGRETIHKNLDSYDISIMRYIMENPNPNKSVEYNDNKISLYIGQLGKCGVTNDILEIGNMEVHHKQPISLNGTDEYKNLIYIRSDVHKMIHATEIETINKYNDLIKPDTKILGKINKLRALVGNQEIKVVN